jgi:hypothetical protein
MLEVPGDVKPRTAASAKAVASHAEAERRRARDDGAPQVSGPPPLGYGEVTPEFAGMLRTTADVERVLGPGD